MKPGGAATASTPEVPVTPDPAPTAPSALPERDLEAVLAEAFAAFHDDAVAYCRSLLGSADLVDDAIQNAFTELLKRIRAGDAAFFEASPWDAVKRNLRWAALKLRREVGVGEKWFSPLDDTRHPVDERWSAIEGQVVVGGILERLPNHMRQVLHLRVFADEPDAVSAECLGITLDAFRCRYKRALSAARSAAQGLGIEGAAAFVAAPFLSLGRRLRSGFRQVSAAAGRVPDTVDVGARFLTLPGVEVVGVATIAVVAAAAAAPAVGGMVSARQVAALSTAATVDSTVGTISSPGRAATGTSPTDGGAARTPVAPAALGVGAVTGSLPGAQASQETPDDSHLYSATPAPSQSNWIVALGWGQRCSCTVVFQSPDRGASWTAAPGPTLDGGAADRVSLPPNYPADSRIFISGPASLNTPSYVTDHFGDAFLPLPVPNGSIAVSPTTGSGDDRIFVAGQSSVWTYQLTTHVLQPVLTDQPVSQVYAAASPTVGSPDLFVVAATTSPVNGSATTLFRCASPTLCTTLSTLPLPMANGVAVSPAFATDHTLAVSWLNGFAVSTDGGNNFGVVALPAGTQFASSSFLMSTNSGGKEIWATVQMAGRTAIMHSAIASARWTPALAGPGDPSVLSATGVGQRVLAILRAGGVSCSDDDGATWNRRCAAPATTN